MNDLLKTEILVVIDNVNKQFNKSATAELLDELSDCLNYSSNLNEYIDLANGILDYQQPEYSDYSDFKNDSQILEAIISELKNL